MENKTRIHVLFTGGTIGSLLGEDGHIHPKRNPYLLLESLEAQYPELAEQVEFLCQEPYRILSENLSSQEINRLGEVISQCLSDPLAAGIVLTHGTDTLAYTGAFLNYMFPEVSKPIILVSSAYVLTDPRANGLENFREAVSYLCEEEKKGGVYVSYQNEGATKASLYPAANIVRHDLYEADVRPCRASHTTVPSAVYEKWLQICQKRQAENKPFLKEKSPVLWLPCYVGMAYPETFAPHTKAVLFDTYHSGTMAITPELFAFAERANAARIQLYLSGLSEGEAAYETVESYSRLGIHILLQRAAIAQYCKLWLAYDNLEKQEQVEAFMKVQIGEE